MVILADGFQTFSLRQIICGKKSFSISFPGQPLHSWWTTRSSSSWKNTVVQISFCRPSWRRRLRRRCCSITTKMSTDNSATFFTVSSSWSSTTTNGSRKTLIGSFRRILKKRNFCDRSLLAKVTDNFGLQTVAILNSFWHIFLTLIRTTDNVRGQPFVTVNLSPTNHGILL